MTRQWNFSVVPPLQIFSISKATSRLIRRDVLTPGIPSEVSDQRLGQRNRLRLTALQKLRSARCHPHAHIRVRVTSKLRRISACRSLQRLHARYSCENDRAVEIRYFSTSYMYPSFDPTVSYCSLLIQVSLSLYKSRKHKSSRSCITEHLTKAQISEHRTYLENNARSCQL